MREAMRNQYDVSTSSLVSNAKLACLMDEVRKFEQLSSIFNCGIAAPPSSDFYT